MIATILFFWYPGWHTPLTTVEFNSPAACEASAAKIEQYSSADVIVFCVPKG